MTKVVCPECRGRGSDVEITCPDCKGSGYDSNEDNPFAQCHTCSGGGSVEADVCPKCDGSGQIEIEYENISTQEISQDGIYECSDCGMPASYVLVDYYHNILGSGVFFCSSHAFDDGREQCPCCDDYQIAFEGENYLPTYPSGALDGEGCCSDHP
jgi:hypothetical protein